MRRLRFIAAATLLLSPLPAFAGERVVCTLARELGKPAPLLQDGQCEDRMSPASTFKVALGLMGFDSGLLISPDEPEMPFRAGYADWNPNWRQPATPRSWMRESVVWYSQRLTEKLGARRFRAYVDAFDYGNRNLSGDRGKNNGLTQAWLSSSLQISPVEQVVFLSRMIDGRLPVSAAAVAQTRALMDSGVQAGGWHLYGKTGAGRPFGADGTLLAGQPFGWYVGWAEKGERTVVFARLVRFDAPPAAGAPGALARDGLKATLFGPGGPLGD